MSEPPSRYLLPERKWFEDLTWSTSILVLNHSTNECLNAGGQRRLRLAPNGKHSMSLVQDDLVVFKVSFNRGKDWVDSETMIVAGTVIDLVRNELLALRGPTLLLRIARLLRLLENTAQ